MRKLQKAILATLIYHDLFDYPLRESEIGQFLIQSRHFNPQVLKKLIKARIICQKDDFYFLPQREKIVSLRKKREKYSQEKLQKAQKIAQLFQFIPGVKMVAVTGALAINNAGKNDDIDLLIITQAKRLWLTRLILVFLLEILGKRRRPQAKKNKNIKDKICLNMFLDETALNLSKERENIFTSHEIAQMQPILNKEQVYEKFLIANCWFKKYLPHAIKIKNIKNLKIKPNDLKFKNKTTIIINFLENLVYQLQIKYMKTKQTNEQASTHFAFFHPDDRQAEVINEYQKRLKKINILY